MQFIFVVDNFDIVMTSIISFNKTFSFLRRCKMQKINHCQLPKVVKLKIILYLCNKVRSLVVGTVRYSRTYNTNRSKRKIVKKLKINKIYKWSDGGNNWLG